MSGIRPYVRATTNPDPNSWVKTVLAPWVDQRWDGGRMEPGELRWIKRVGDGLEAVPPETEGAITLTFVPASVRDNQALLAQNPDYLKNLELLPLVERMALLHGSWEAVATGNFFRREWWQWFTGEPSSLRYCRFWDMAATKPKPGKDPDYTVGALLGIDESNLVYVLDVQRLRESPLETEKLVARCADEDPAGTAIRMEQEGGSSGVIVIDHYAREVLAGFDFEGVRSTGSKEERAKPFSAFAEQGYVHLPKGASWVDTFIAESSAFPDPRVHDDQVDAASGAFSVLTGGPMIFAPEVVENKTNREFTDYRPLGFE